jgi:hypothetical protein
MLLAGFGSQTRPETPSRIDSPSRNAGQDSWTPKSIRARKLAASLGVHACRESHVTGVTGRFVQNRTSSEKLSEIRYFHKRSLSNEVTCQRVSGRFWLSQTGSKTVPKGNGRSECAKFGVCFGYGTA